MSDTGKPFREGEVAKEIENETARVPSDIFLWSAFGCMGAALVLRLMGRKHSALFIGQWVAPMLLFGIYNKQVKQLGHDAEDEERKESMSLQENVV
jgi:hypothetical protein